MTECTINHGYLSYLDSLILYSNLYFIRIAFRYEKRIRNKRKDRNKCGIRTLTILFYRSLFFRPVVTPKFDSGKKENEANLSKKSESKQFIAASLDFPPTRKKKSKRHLKLTNEIMLWKCPVASWYFSDIELWSQSQSDKGGTAQFKHISHSQHKSHSNKTWRHHRNFVFSRVFPVRFYASQYDSNKVKFSQYKSNVFVS